MNPGPTWRLRSVIGTATREAAAGACWAHQGPHHLPHGTHPQSPQQPKDVICKHGEQDGRVMGLGPGGWTGHKPARDAAELARLIGELGAHTLLTALLEALTEQLDNLVLPMWHSVLLLLQLLA